MAHLPLNRKRAQDTWAGLMRVGGLSSLRCVPCMPVWGCVRCLFMPWSAEQKLPCFESVFPEAHLTINFGYQLDCELLPGVGEGMVWMEA